MTTDELERRLTIGLRETLDGEFGPHPLWADAPAARRAAELHRNRRWRPLRVLAVAAVLGAAVGAALLAGAPEQREKVANGWIAYSAFDPAGGDPDTDIWFTALDQQPRRVIGTDTDGLDQACPAFSPDGRHLAYGTVEGLWSTGSSPVWPAYRNSALVIANVAEDGRVADSTTIDVGDGVPLPCPVWSRDGDHLAFGVPLTSPINPLRSGAGSEVWIVRLADRNVTVIPDLLATDLEWSPDGSVLAIAGGVEPAADGNGLQDPRIHLHDEASGDLRSIESTLGVGSLTWSPDGRRIAYATGDSTHELRVLDVETGRQEVLTGRYRAVHGVGPVWSPDGDTVAYQRVIDGSAERHEVVLVMPDDRSAQTGFASEVAMPMERTTTDGSIVELFPWRVTWSPDGQYLLYVAWTYPNGCCFEGTSEQTLVVAVPTDPDAPAVVLGADAEALAYDSDDTMRVPIQTWGQLLSN